jgi:glycine/D-amino acid oxidase-like deaminating enzyme
MTEVLVIGAGISGALIAEALTDAGLEVLVVDRRGPLAGSTAATTALIQYELDMPIVKLARRIGQARAERLWRRSRLAVEALGDRMQRLRIGAEQVARDTLYLEGSELDRAGLLAEQAARRRAGLETDFLEARDVLRRFGIRRRAALHSSGGFCVEPRRLAAGFLNAALARGATICAPAEVTRVQPGRRMVRATTKDGPVIRCRHLVFASGYEMPTAAPTKGQCIRSTWVIATAPQRREPWEGSAMISEAAEPYLYLRTTPDRRIICGGEDEDFADEARRDAKLPEKTATLSRKLAALLPGVDARPAFAWCGSFGTSRNSTPTIGRLPRMPNCYAALGYGGNGITFAMMAAQMLRGLVTGGGDPDLDLVSFRSSRKSR